MGESGLNLGCRKADTEVLTEAGPSFQGQRLSRNQEAKEIHHPFLNHLFFSCQTILRVEQPEAGAALLALHEKKKLVSHLSSLHVGLFSSSLQQFRNHF